MKNGKASGPDSVKNENVKMLVEELLPEITSFSLICVSEKALTQRTGGKRH
jgi:hypothetical protein